MLSKGLVCPDSQESILFVISLFKIVSFRTPPFLVKTLTLYHLYKTVILYDNNLLYYD